MIADRAALDSFARRASSSTVGGSELSGMSASVVTPPAAAPRVAALQPSHSSRPGSLTCTCASRTPSSVTTRPPRIARSAVAVLDLFDEEVLCALPEREAAELGKLLVALDHRREVIARELADLAREEARAIREEDLHLGDASGIDKHLSRRGMAGVILVSHAETPLAHRDPGGLAAPTDMHELAAHGEHPTHRIHRLRRVGLFPARLECVGPSGDAEHLHRGRTIPARWRARRSPRTCSIRPTACRPSVSRSRSIAT